MKKLNISLLLTIAAVLNSCSGSDAYRGVWKAMDSDGLKFEIVFNAKNFIVSDSTGKSEKFDYAQYSINIENSISIENSEKIENSTATYGIKLGDGRKYQITFPNANDEGIGIIKDENGSPLYTISRKDYMNYDDIYKLK